ncbi:uncharacterized protein LOC118435673 [Folsomia candida]|uniref:Odorant receptor n=1 Tax=Folsomia candida TaxID=158441 RepID=A0A226EAE8_FOLCA|nr:uncharacterized protein LOC118435673 [Folsomia candida]OXA54515.1 hypothetical protein Fcan01_10596 [Folsomia candida]
MIVRVLIPFLKRYLNLAKRFSASYFEWDESRGKIVLRDVKHHANVKAWLLLHIVYVVLQTLLICFAEFHLVEKCSAVMILALYITCLILRLETRVDLVPMELNNWSISQSYEDFARDTSPTRLEIVIKYLCNFFELSCIVDPLFITILIVFIPCRTPLLGPMLICNQKIVSITTTLVVAVIEGIVASFIFMGTYQYSAFSLVTGILILYAECVSFLDRGFDSVEHWLRNYRELQILEKTVNSSLRERILPAMILILPIVQILSCLVFVILLKDDKVISSVIFFIVYLECLGLTMLILSFAANIFVKTGKWVSQFPPGQSKTHRRIVKSFQPVKVQFGNNFVDALTPLVFQQFCATQTASLLVLKYKL